MATETVSEVLGNNLLLQRIFSLSDFNNVKKLRLVNKHWNTIACHDLRSRCRAVHIDQHGGWEQYNQVDLDFPNRDIIIQIPLVARMYIRDDLERHFETFLRTQFNSARWKSQIVDLSVWYLDVVDANRVTPFLLQQLPALKKLHFEGDCDSDAAGLEIRRLDNFTPLPVSPGSKFRLESLKIHTLMDTTANVFDLSVLRHCPDLKEFNIIHDWSRDWNSDSFLDFLQRWIQLLQQDEEFPRVQHFDFTVLMRGTCKTWRRETGKTVAQILRALAKLINLNKPTSLGLLGDMDYNLQTLFGRLRQWTPGIQVLKTWIPVDDCSNECRTDLLFRLLRKFKLFADLKEICLHMPMKKEEAGDSSDPSISFELNEAAFRSRSRLQLQNVNSLELEFGDPFTGQFEIGVLEEAQQHVPNISRLKLQLRLREDLDFGQIADVCQGFPGLRELSLVLMNAYSELIRWHKEIWNNVHVGGYCKSLLAVENLKSLKVLVRETPAEFLLEQVLATLFLGHKPRVSLDMEICTSIFEGTEEPRQFSAEEFQKTLEQAERNLRKSDSKWRHKRRKLMEFDHTVDENSFEDLFI